MARGVNKVILVGNLGADPEMRHTGSGTAICSFNLATSESWTDKQGIERYSTDIIANEMQMLGGPGEGGAGGGGYQRERPQGGPRQGGGSYGGQSRGNDDRGSSRPSSPAPADNGFTDDEIPF